MSTWPHQTPAIREQRFRFGSVVSSIQVQAQHTYQEKGYYQHIVHKVGVNALVLQIERGANWTLLSKCKPHHKRCLVRKSSFYVCMDFIDSRLDTHHHSGAVDDHSAWGQWRDSAPLLAFSGDMHTHTCAHAHTPTP